MLAELWADADQQKDDLERSPEPLQAAMVHASREPQLPPEHQLRSPGENQSDHWLGC